MHLLADLTGCSFLRFQFILTTLFVLTFNLLTAQTDFPLGYVNAEKDTDINQYQTACRRLRLGYYSEACSLFKECLKKNEAKGPSFYLNTLYHLSLSYNLQGDVTSSRIIGFMGKNKSTAAGFSPQRHKQINGYFCYVEGINQYCLENYEKASQNLLITLSETAAGNDYATKQSCLYYLGQSYIVLRQPIKAMSYFRRVDDIYSRYGYIHPSSRAAYEKLIDYYIQNENAKLQLYYIDRLLKADLDMGKSYPYLLDKTLKTYTTDHLKRQRAGIERKLSARNRKLLIAALFILLSCISSYYYFKKKKTVDKTIGNIKPKATNLSPQLETHLLTLLKEFELGKGYLEKDLNLVRMATLLETNTKYASKAIFVLRGKSTIEYLNDLKMDHVIGLLQSEAKYRNYTNKALADEAGFGSAKHFAKLFIAKTGVSVSEFVARIKE